MEERRQKINCTVGSCKYHNQNNECLLRQIEVQPCLNGTAGTPEDESMCGNYLSR